MLEKFWEVAQAVAGRVAGIQHLGPGSGFWAKTDDGLVWHRQERPELDKIRAERRVNSTVQRIIDIPVIENRLGVEPDILFASFLGRTLRVERYVDMRCPMKGDILACEQLHGHFEALDGVHLDQHGFIEWLEENRDTVNDVDVLLGLFRRIQSAHMVRASTTDETVINIKTSKIQDDGGIDVRLPEYVQLGFSPWHRAPIMHARVRLQVKAGAKGLVVSLQPIKSSHEWRGEIIKWLELSFPDRRVVWGSLDAVAYVGGEVAFSYPESYPKPEPEQ